MPNIQVVTSEDELQQLLEQAKPRIAVTREEFNLLGARNAVASARVDSENALAVVSALNAEIDRLRQELKGHLQEQAKMEVIRERYDEAFKVTAAGIKRRMSLAEIVSMYPSIPMASIQNVYTELYAAHAEPFIAPPPPPEPPKQTEPEVLFDRTGKN